MQIANSISNKIRDMRTWRSLPALGILPIILVASWVLRVCRSSTLADFLCSIVTRGLNYGLATLAMVAMHQFCAVFRQKSLAADGPGVVPIGKN